jgi:hypothetical protein
MRNNKNTTTNATRFQLWVHLPGIGYQVHNRSHSIGSLRCSFERVVDKTPMDARPMAYILDTHNDILIRM